MATKLTPELLKRALIPLLVWLWGQDYVDTMINEDNYRALMQDALRPKPFSEMDKDDHFIIKQAAFNLKGYVEGIKTAREEIDMIFDFTDADDKIQEALTMFGDLKAKKLAHKLPYEYANTIETMCVATLQQGVLMWLHCVLDVADLTRTQAEYEAMHIENICELHLK